MTMAAQALVEHVDTVASAARQEIAAAPSVAMAQMSESAAIFQIIERAARDPNVDIDKMERLIKMQEAVQARQAELEFDEAMSAAQEAMQPVRADANNTQTRSKYATFAALDAAIRPIYTKHGFSVSYSTDDSPLDGHVRVVAKVARGGHRERPHIDMPADGKGAKGGDVMTKTHATGSAIQYGRRYLLGMIFNIAVSRDDDGNAAGKAVDDGFIDDAQINQLREAIEDNGGDIARFCRFAKVDALADIGRRHFAEAMRAAKQGARQ